MTVITIRNVPDELNERLKLRARERGQSLQQFLPSVLIQNHVLILAAQNFLHHSLVQLLK